MSTYREVVYLVNDELKNISDDGLFTEEHIIFLADKYRAFVLKQRYADIRKDIPESNYQTICVDLERVTLPSSDICGSGEYLRSTKKIPAMTTLGSRIISPINFFSGNFNYVSNSRFKYTGYNKYLKNQAYGTIGPDHYLYLKSSDQQFYFLEKVKLTGIFEDASKLIDFQCDETDKVCNILDMEFPLEEAIIPVVIELIVKELTAIKYQAADTKNNANDDISDLATFLRSEIAKGRYSDLFKNV